MANLSFTASTSQDNIDHVMMKLQGCAAGQKVWINSLGGKVKHLLAEAERLEKLRFVTVGHKVGSAAKLLFLLGSKRYVLPEAKFFFHEVVSIDLILGRRVTMRDMEVELDFTRFDGRSDLLLESGVRESRNVQSALISFVKKRSRMSPETIFKLMKNEVTLSAKEAVHYGLADEVISGKEVYYKNFFS